MPPDLYITTKSGLGFDDSFSAPAEGEYGIKFSSGSGLGFSGAPIQSGGFNVAGLPKWSAAIQAMKAGTRNAVLCGVGESTTAGTGSAAPQKKNSYLAQIGGKLRTYGFAVYDATFSGDNAQTFSNISVYDDRISFSPDATNWSVNGTAFGGQCIRTGTTGTNKLVFAPGYICDTFRIRVRNANVGVMNIFIDGGSTPVGTITVSNTGTVFSQDVNFPRGIHTIELQRVSGYVDIASWAAFDSTVKGIIVYNGGQAGQRAATVGSTLAMDSLKNLSPDLCLVNEAINDTVNATADATYYAGMQGIFDACIVSGDVLYCNPNPIQNPTNNTLLTTWFNNLKSTNPGLKTVDFNSLLGGSWGPASSSGWMTDALHPNTAGYAVEAQAVFAAITP